MGQGYGKIKSPPIPNPVKGRGPHAALRPLPKGNGGFAGRIFLFVILLFAFTSCSREYNVPADLIRIHLNAEPPTLNPITSVEAAATSVNAYIYDSLIERNRDTLEWESKMAERWEISPDQKQYTFYLRRDVTWHDGHPFTADDVVYSFQLIMDPRTDDPHLKVYYKDIERVEKIDAYTVRFHYKKVYFLALSVCGSIPIVPKHIVEKEPDFNTSSLSRHPVGTGPYRFKEWVPNQRIVLTRYDGYFDKKPAIKTLQYQIITDNAVAFQVLKKGELDYMSLFPIQWAKQTRTAGFHEKFYKLAYPNPGNGYTYIGWNNASPFFNDARVRRAMTHLVDRQKIIDKLLFGLARIVTGPFYPFSKQYNGDITPLQHDVQKARELLKEAGWVDTDGDGILDKDGRPFAFDLILSSGNPIRERIATILKEDLKNVGIKARLLRYEWGAFLSRIMKRDFDATILGWTGDFETDPYQVWDESQAKVKGSSNFISFENHVASALIREARVEFDEKKRNQIYHQFQDILHELQPYTFLFAQTSLVAVSRRFGNVKIHKAGLYLPEWTVD